MGGEDYKQPCPRECWTCKHRREIELDAMSLFVSTKGQSCREFISMDGRTGKYRNLPCGYAYDTFCNGTMYKDDFWTWFLGIFSR